MTSQPRRPGFTITDLAVTLAATALLLCATLPVLAGLRGDAGVQQSASNLIQMALAHVLYAADWDGRQVTWTADDLGAYGGSPHEYNESNCCHPPILAGWDCDLGLWGYFTTNPNDVMFQPIGFPDGVGYPGFGHFRIPNTRPFHFYLNGRYHDGIFYAPKDATLLAQVEDCIGSLCEFNPQVACNPGWSSYCFSPAAQFHPDVMRSNASGGWQAPWSLDHGYESPGFFQPTYPDLKTLMLEHSWLQVPPGECNPFWTGCEPYWFNQGLGSAPVTLFYDGSIRLLGNAEVLAADSQVLADTGGVDGLWHRGTPFGTEGYFISAGYDGTPLSHHILTTDGILGRDTLADIGPIPAAHRARLRKGPGTPTPVTDLPPVELDIPPFTAAGDQP